MIVIKNAEIVGKKTCTVPRSELIKNVLEVLEKTGYVEKIQVNKRDIDIWLSGKVNDSRAITPRHSCGYKDIEKFEKRYLPTKDIGIIIISTSTGIVDHKEAKEKKVGGKLLAYVY